eukprot:NODE_1678_length_773_cov_22.407121_g1629_i0.p1 GENE.NODE_1678_length_773_cov_22.407121_g1629_i0~~NODE_1678_length_773_cov_22.407121_g1629_i0.p1  ORF type:complete len:172 (+),score=12.27 NODE_1678_length_773_cov_22.407121_g1629_i0:136-651(+)
MAQTPTILETYGASSASEAGSIQGECCDCGCHQHHRERSESRNSNSRPDSRASASSSLLTAYSKVLSKADIEESHNRDPCLRSGFFQTKKTGRKGTFSTESRFKTPVGWKKAYTLGDEYHRRIAKKRDRGLEPVSQRIVTSRWDVHGTAAPGPGAYTPTYSHCARKARTGA